MSTTHEVEILLVEDSPNDVELTLRALREVNLANRIFVARDGEEALDFLLARGPHADRNAAAGPKAVLLDLKLPKVSGLEVLAVLRADPRLGSLPVVVLTSSAEEPDIAKAYELGANSYIVKPVGFEDFVRAVSDAGLYWLLLNRPPIIT